MEVKYVPFLKSKQNEVWFYPEMTDNQLRVVWG